MDRLGGIFRPPALTAVIHKNLSYLQYLLIAGPYTAEALQGMMMVVDNIADAYEAHSDLVKLINPQSYGEHVATKYRGLAR